MSTLRKLGNRKIPAWICETHVRELDDVLIDDGLDEAIEVLTDCQSEWLRSCSTCRAEFEYMSVKS